MTLGDDVPDDLAMEEEKADQVNGFARRGIQHGAHFLDAA